MPDLIKYQERSVTVNTPHQECLDSAQLTAMCVYRETEYEVEIKTSYTKGVMKKKKRELVDNSKLLDFLSVLIIDAFQFYGKETTGVMVRDLATIIFETYYFLKVDEIKLFFKQLKSGKWKQVHNFSPAVLMERLAEFSEESMELRTMIGEDDNSRNAIEYLTDEQKAGLIELTEKYVDKSKLSRDEMREAQIKYIKEKK